jgi:hypothetical protein
MSAPTAHAFGCRDLSDRGLPHTSSPPLLVSELTANPMVQAHQPIRRDALAHGPLLMLAVATSCCPATSTGLVMAHAFSEDRQLSPSQIACPLDPGANLTPAVLPLGE